jgi:hypothetical protein
MHGFLPEFFAQGGSRGLGMNAWPRSASPTDWRGTLPRRAADVGSGAILMFLQSIAICGAAINFSQFVLAVIFDGIDCNGVPAYV